MSPFLAFTLKMDRFQNAPFSNSCVFISVFEKPRFHSGAEQCERKAKTEKFFSVFIWKRGSVNGALGALGKSLI